MYRVMTKIPDNPEGAPVASISDRFSKYQFLKLMWLYTFKKHYWLAVHQNQQLHSKRFLCCQCEELGILSNSLPKGIKHGRLHHILWTSEIPEVFDYMQLRSIHRLWNVEHVTCLKEVKSRTCILRCCQVRPEIQLTPDLMIFSILNWTYS